MSLFEPQGINIGPRIRGNSAARLANSARFRLRPVGTAINSMAVQTHGENTGDGGLSYPSMSAEDKTMRYALLFDGILQCTGNVVLPDHLRKALRTIFARQYLVTHGKSDYTLGKEEEFSTARRIC